jgi:hypothetical protein
VVAQPHHGSPPRPTSTGTFRLPRFVIDLGPRSDIRWGLRRLLQDGDIGIGIKKSSPRIRATRDVPGNQLHASVLMGPSNALRLNCDGVRQPPHRPRIQYTVRVLPRSRPRQLQIRVIRPASNPRDPDPEPEVSRFARPGGG